MQNFLKLGDDLRENVSFVLISLAIAVGLALIAKLLERFLPGVRKVKPATRVTIVGICAALATVLHLLDFPLLFLAPGFYKLDFSEVPVLLCGFYLGPGATVVCEGGKILLKLLLKGTSTAFVGDLANFVVGCSMVIPAVFLYHLKKNRASALWGLILGTLCMTVFGSVFNAVYLLPAFSRLYGMDLEAIISMGGAVNGAVTDVTTFVILCVAPLNLLKGTAVSVLVLLLYKKVARPLFSLGA